MIKIVYFKHGIRLAHVYFYGDDFSNLNHDLDGCDIAFFHGCIENIPQGILVSQQHTLIKYIGYDVTEEELFLSMGKHLRKNIRKCEREDSPSISFYCGKEILENPLLLQNCKKIYEKMFFDKGEKRTFNTKLAKRFARQDSLILGIASIDNNPIGFTTMVVDNNNARAWVGAFDYRESIHDGYLLARLHRLLNWRRMLYCRERGINFFDFGGISSFDNPEPRDLFKLEFEKENRTTYKNFLVANTTIGEIALWFYEKIKKR